MYVFEYLVCAVAGQHSKASQSNPLSTFLTRVNLPQIP